MGDYYYFAPKWGNYLREGNYPREVLLIGRCGPNILFFDYTIKIIIQEKISR